MNAYPLEFSQTENIQLIPFIVSGDPSLEVSLEMITMLENEGVTAIELGVPFSDPQADGPVIQHAGGRALSKDVTLRDVLSLGREVRKRGGKVPLILFSYFNPILQYGLEQLVKDALAAGFSGMIIPDLPHNESGSLRALAHQVDLPVIPLVAPTTSPERIKQIVQDARGFVYCVSSAGTTGMRSHFSDQVTHFLSTVKEASKVPIAVGFGISSHEQVSYFQQHVDGVVVGSALVKEIGDRVERLEKPQERALAMQEIQTFVRDLMGK